MSQKVLRLPVLPLRDTVIFPDMRVPLFVGREKSISALNYSVGDSSSSVGLIFLVAQRDGGVDYPSRPHLYDVGVTAEVAQLVKLPDNTVKILVSTLDRATVVEYVEDDECLLADVVVREQSSGVDVSEAGTDCDEQEIVAFRRVVLASFDSWSKLCKKVRPDLVNTISNISDPGHFADTVAYNLAVKVVDLQDILETFSVILRLEKVCRLIEGEIEILETEKRLRARIKNQMAGTQRAYYLGEQLKAIQKELGETDNGKIDSDTIAEFEDKIATVKLSNEAKEKALADLRRYSKMSIMSPEATVIANYLQWLLDLPWGVYSKARINLDKAMKVLCDHHYGMDEVKERVIEYLSVLKRIKVLNGPILCLWGPPGVGKTSLAKSIALATGREFVRLSLGGMRDESEIRGHRRTYIGSMPGKIIQNLKKAKTSNPVFLLDEIDKLNYDFRGDPASALLEVLDSAHNAHFSDHYLEVEFDLSSVMFVATANTLSDISLPLLDRMEVIHISGYTDSEKVQIATRHLIPKLLKDHGLTSGKFSLGESGIYRIIRKYTMESGVRNLEKNIAKLMRKSVRKMMTDSGVRRVSVDENNLSDYLGVDKYEYDFVEKEAMVGVVNGLAYTETGGTTLTLESVLVRGKGHIKCTGKLGDVMKESAQAAYSYFCANCHEYGVRSAILAEFDVHLHAPAGAVPKDGPSAGIAIFASIVSLFTGLPAASAVAMTGEITLRGRVLPIGGLKEKLLAAVRVGISKVIIPERNKKDLEEIPDDIKDALELVCVDHVNEVAGHTILGSYSPCVKDALSSPSGMVQSMSDGVPLESSRGEDDDEDDSEGLNVSCSDADLSVCDDEVSEVGLSVDRNCCSVAAERLQQPIDDSDHKSGGGVSVVDSRLSFVACKNKSPFSRKDPCMYI